jgi:hypothetical protein
MNAPALSPLRIGKYQFEQVESFTYVGTKVNTKNSISEKIKTSIMVANSFFGLHKRLKCRLISRTTKIQLYRTFIRLLSSHMGLSAGHSPNQMSNSWICLKGKR